MPPVDREVREVHMGDTNASTRNVGSVPEARRQLPVHGRPQRGYRAVDVSDAWKLVRPHLDATCAAGEGTATCGPPAGPASGSKKVGLFP